MIEIPVTTAVGDFEQSIELGLEVFRLRFTFNTRSESWHVTISDAEGNILLGCRRLRTDWPLTSQFVDKRLPQGVLQVVDRIGTRLEPGRDAIGDTHPILFATTEEVEAAEAS